jgi:hypothetical protein
MIIGAVVIFISLSLITYLVFKSRRTIEMIHRRNLKSAREIVKKINES